jgi:acetolactate decarboxylase
MKFKALQLFALVILFCSKSFAQINKVNIIGAMKNVMWQGQLYGTINIDTIANKANLYGLGPVEYLTGEVLIVDGVSYKSTVVNDTTMKVEKTFKIKAPFLGYTNIDKWKEIKLPNKIQTIAQLETYINKITAKSQRPFMFKMSGFVDSASIHIVNLAPGSTVNSPDDAHKGQKNYSIYKEQVDIVGFFSTEHKAILTHHDTFLHLHLITQNKAKMGHLDRAYFKKGKFTLFLPN